MGSFRQMVSLRVGDYRVIYVIDEQRRIVLLYDVGYRKKVYN